MTTGLPPEKRSGHGKRVSEQRRRVVGHLAGLLLTVRQMIPHLEKWAKDQGIKPPGRSIIGRDLKLCREEWRATRVGDFQTRQDHHLGRLQQDLTIYTDERDKARAKGEYKAATRWSDLCTSVLDRIAELSALNEPVKLEAIVEQRGAVEIKVVGLESWGIGVEPPAKVKA